MAFFLSAVGAPVIGFAKKGEAERSVLCSNDVRSEYVDQPNSHMPHQ
jgi:hypothetical protein